MMRSIAALLAVFSFVSVAFVPPTPENLLASLQGNEAMRLHAQDVAHAAGEVTTVLTGLVTAAGRKIGDNAGALTDMAMGVTSTASSIGGAGAKQLVNAAKEKAVKEVKKAVVAEVNKKVKTVINNAKAPVLPTLRKLLSAEEKEAFSVQLTIIERAVTDQDVRVCGELHGLGPGDGLMAPSFGDFMALCVAKVSGDARRCAQIDDSLMPPLHSICERVTGTTT